MRAQDPAINGHGPMIQACELAAITIILGGGAFVHVMHQAGDGEARERAGSRKGRNRDRVA
jgi:hypothetical protein